ncbi:helix-turn-helix domain-containing protein [Streptomyces sp. LP05-1]|uniref:Helix-turn-helix domain-containing protein n=1 Tax=Streptomyces pyxinae TaxID=2970734 RepID=A0ABT2CFJ6_9ACTN|nr:helix-turn-helix domain-containing protein [Streptomyces sp. LP05-1]MCS0636187.1 helix-turn-helix domain-containing protein [Streptomyces sp. LP05-1]
MDLLNQPVSAPVTGPVGGGGSRPGDTRRALGDFLRARRERLTPEHIGVAAGRRRRVPGLRREELAQRAGISVDYYVRLEQGRATAPSPEVLDALAAALELDAAERRHLATLADLRRAPAPRLPVGPRLHRIVDALALPAFATDPHTRVRAWNPLGAALMGGLAEPGRRDPNQARWIFLDPAAREVFPDWEARAAEAAGQLRVAAGRYPDDRELAALITGLSGQSAEFRRIWGAGEVTMCAGGQKRVRHPLTGVLHLDYETLHLPAGPGETGLVVHVFSPADDSPESRALARLAATLPPPAGPVPDAGRPMPRRASGGAEDLMTRGAQDPMPR